MRRFEARLSTPSHSYLGVADDTVRKLIQAPAYLRTEVPKTAGPTTGLQTHRRIGRKQTHWIVHHFA
jgi:hypothetical protein